MTLQLSLLCEATPRRKSQADRVLNLLRSKEWVRLPEILDLRVANYTARLSDLRKQGYTIECVKENVRGELHTRYRLLGEPE